MGWQLPGSTKNAASFQFDGEDHTLGNALRYIIMKKYVHVATLRGR
jgi:DNA-directed RNA polymerase I and III subunit RPAC2